MWESTGQEAQAGGARPAVPPGEEQGWPALSVC